jgi:hypothetical protein
MLLTRVILLISQLFKLPSKTGSACGKRSLTRAYQRAFAVKKRKIESSSMTLIVIALSVIKLVRSYALFVLS